MRGMNIKSKKKLCWNCGGNASLEDEHCHYCGVYLSPLPLDGKVDENSLFKPPYRLDEVEEDQDVPPSPYAPEQEEIDQTNPQEPTKKEKQSVDLSKEIVLPIFLLLSGMVFLFFSLALLLFSQNGVLTLTWSGSYWAFYMGFALLMLFLGWRTLQKHEP